MLNITEKIVLGTAQFGMDYGIANMSGKPSKNEVFSILDFAWRKGIRNFDTAQGYGSEALLGEFIRANTLKNEIQVLTKISSLKHSTDYQKSIRLNLENSLKHLGCNIDVLFFHNSADSSLLLKDPQFFENLLSEYPVKTIGVSVYEPKEVQYLSACLFNLAFQFPCNVLDRRFNKVRMIKGKRYARSVLLQGLLVSTSGLRTNSPNLQIKLLDLQKEYLNKLASHKLDPLRLAISYVAQQSFVDYFLIGVDSIKQLESILSIKLYNKHEIIVVDRLKIKINKKLIDPRIWIDPKIWN